MLRRDIWELRIRHSTRKASDLLSGLGSVARGLAQCHRPVGAESDIARLGRPPPRPPNPQAELRAGVASPTGKRAG